MLPFLSFHTLKYIVNNFLKPADKRTIFTEIITLTLNSYVDSGGGRLTWVEVMNLANQG